MSSASSRPVGVAVAQRPAIAVEWAIAREAVRRARPELELPAGRRRSGDVLLSISIAGDACQAELRDTQTNRSHPIEIGAVRIETLRADEFVHIRVVEGGNELLSATMRDHGSDSRLLYARTLLFDRLGIKGGRYTRPSLGDAHNGGA